LCEQVNQNLIRIEKKLDRILEALGVDPEDWMDLDTAINMSARTLDFSYIQNYLRRKNEKEGRIKKSKQERR